MRLVVSLGILVVAVGAFVYSISGDHAARKKPTVEKAEAKPAASPSPVLLEGIGDYRMRVTALNDDARKWFDQGVNLAFAFNHAAAVQSFLEAARMDDRCAMCWWGAAWALGPHINAGMAPSDYPVALDYLEKAVAASVHVSEREQALIGALRKRYQREVPISREPLDQQYADAMRDVRRQFPDDVEVKVLLAESLMILHPWDYHDERHRPRPWTAEIVDLLASVLDANDAHPAAHHFLIHLLEHSDTPERALPSAIKLAGMAPAAGHLQHVPAHIYARLGRHHEAMLAHQAAVEADARYRSIWPLDTGLYGWAYTAHHLHSLYASSLIIGQSNKAIEAADRLAGTLDLGRARQPGYEAIQHLWVSPYFARVAFARWSDILELPPPPADLAYPTAIWHYARGLSLVYSGDLGRAREELESLKTISAHPQLEALHFWGQAPFSTLALIADFSLAAQLESAEGRHREALMLIGKAAELEASLPYEMPALWLNSTRVVQARLFLAAGNRWQSIQIAQQALEERPNDGRLLWVLYQAQKALGRPFEATQKRFDLAWQFADAQLPEFKP
tara:strand:- start:6533 stop:8224 length:1692 start_codon:yes stop_codon:yes gene_type:complete